MKTLKTIYYLLMFLPLVATLIALQFLPVAGSGAIVDGAWNAPYETILIPVAGFLFGWLLLDILQTSTKDSGDGEKINIGMIVIAVILAVFAFFTYQGLANQFARVGSVPFPRNVSQFIAGIVALILLVYGNVVPKLPEASPFGLRTKWSLLDEEAWRKSQVATGLACVLAGVVIIVLSVYLSGWPLILWMLATIVIAIIAAALYSKKAAQEDPF